VNCIERCNHYLFNFYDLGKHLLGFIYAVYFHR